MLTGKGVRPGPPAMEGSTKVALAIVAGVILGGFAVPWFPYPAGWIYFVAIVYLAIPLTLMVVLDLSRLRQLRIVARNLEVFPPVAQGEAPWVNIDSQPIADEYLTRWRRWSRWLAGSLGLAVLMPVLRIPVGVALIPAVIGLTREAFLVANVLEWLVPTTWAGLTRWERFRLRACVAIIAVVNATIALVVLAIVISLFVFERPIRPNYFAFTFFFGMLAVACALRSYRYFERLRQAVPSGHEESERPV
jgi:hypothetical protein